MPITIKKLVILLKAISTVIIMSKSKIGIGTVEAHKKFNSLEEASRYAKRLKELKKFL